MDAWWWAGFLAYFIGPAIVPLALTARLSREVPLHRGRLLAFIAVAILSTALLGFGWVDLVGIGVAVYPFGAALTGWLAGMPQGWRVVGPMAGALGLTLVALGVLVHGGVPPLKTALVAQWSIFVLASLALVAVPAIAPAHRVRVVGVAALAVWACAIAGPLDATGLFMPPPAILASQAWLGAVWPWRRRAQ